MQRSAEPARWEDDQKCGPLRSRPATRSRWWCPKAGNTWGKGDGEANDRPPALLVDGREHVDVVAGRRRIERPSGHACSIPLVAGIGSRMVTYRQDD